MQGLPTLKIALLAVLVFLPLACSLLLQIPGWIYADDNSAVPFFWKYFEVIVVVCWAGAFLAMLLSSPHFDLKRESLHRLAGITLFVLFFSWVAGGTVGSLIVTLLNCAADRTEGREAKIAHMKEEGREITFRIETPFPATFTCGLGRVNKPFSEGRKRFFVHPGRLGKVWGEFR